MTAVQQQFIENRMKEKDIENIVYVLPAYVDGEQ
jgi:type VI protein secretion system component VasF